MNSAKSAGRVVGVLLFVQLAGLIVPFVLLLPLTAGPTGYLANAVEAAFQIKVAVFLLYANCALTIGITLAGLRVFRQYSEGAAFWLLAASVIMFVMQAVDNVYVLSMLTLSRNYAEAARHDTALQMVAAAVGSMRAWAHTTELLAVDVWILSLYCILYRFRFVPRSLAVFGLVTVVLHFTGIPLRALLGYGPVALMGIPMAFSHVTLASWLVAKGLNDRRLSQFKTVC